MRHPLDSARDKLHRAKENIGNLNIEVSKFLADFPEIKVKGKNPRFTDEDRNAFEILKQNAVSGKSFPRLSVLTGEIVHHLRSAFDHVAWQLSTPDARQKFSTQIEFPVCGARPECIIKTDGKVKHSGYCRKVQGIGTLTALARIDALQPFKGENPFDSSLYLIHTIDLLDKHRTLIDVTPRLATQIWGYVKQTMQTVKDPASGGWIPVSPAGPPKMEMYTKISPQVAIVKIKDWECRYPLVPFLEDLSSFAANSIESFACEFE